MIGKRALVGFRKCLKKYPWVVFLLIAGVALLLSPVKSGPGNTITWDLSATGTVLAELLIAFVIFYEIEETRISEFLRDAQGRAYDSRREIYHEFVKMQGTTLVEKAKAFSEHIWKTPPLRQVCDYQFAYFSHVHYLVDRSLLHRDLLTEWFPQVMVRMWAMLSDYAVSNERLGIRAARELAIEVVSSIEAITRSDKKYPPLTIHSDDGQVRVTISDSDLEKLKNSAKTYLKTSAMV